MAKGVGSKVGNDGGADVAGGAEIEGDIAGPQPIQQARIIDGADAVGDALHAQNLDRIPDAQRTGYLAGVGPQAQPVLSRQTKGRSERSRRAARFVAMQVDTDDSKAAAARLND